jgi:hypothetical protein
MPENLTRPDSILTYGKVVSYVLDQREGRIKGQEVSQKFWEIFVDVMIVIGQLLTMVGYSKYVVE